MTQTGKYPIDEGRNYNRKASKWLLTYIQKNDDRYLADTLPKLHVATLDIDATRFFFRNETKRIEVVEGALADTGLRWDYYLSYIDDMPPRQLKLLWNDREDVLKTYKADGKQVTLILRTLPDTTAIVADTLVTDSIAIAQNKVTN